MSEILKLKKPYEISVWGDRLVTVSDSESYFEEVKLVVIGSDTMTALNRVSSPILTINTSGEKTLTFSLNYYYFDELVGDFVVNPFSHLLVNERKIKLKYNDEWHDFVIKERVEDSETYEYQYTCTDAFIQELSKTGYHITFNADINNNQGTIVELAKETLKDTDWIVDEKNSDLLRQTVSEPIFTCTLSGSFSALNLDTNEFEIIQAQQISGQPEKFYIFYNYVTNKIEDNLQFIRESDIGPNSYDDNNALRLTNYRYIDKAIHDTEHKTITVGGGVFNVGEINLQSQGYRLVYNLKTTYDPVMGQNVKLLEAELDHETQDIYSYTTYDYASSAVVVSYIANGSNFTLYDTGNKKKSNRVVGWDNQCVGDGNTLSSIEYTTRPKIDPTVGVADLNNLNRITGYLQLQYKAANPNDKYANAFYNSGITENANVIDHIAKGEEYVFRVRYGWSNTADGAIQFPKPSLNNTTLRAVVAKYTYVDKALGDKTTVKVKKIDKNNIYFDFTGNFIQRNNKVTGGKLINNDTLYVIDNVVQTPSLNCAYEVENGDKYVWNPNSSKYVINSLPVSQGGYAFMPSYYTVAAARQALSHATLTNRSENIGLFLYDTTASDRYVFIEDVAFFKKVVDADGKIIFPGDAPPVAQSIEQEVFYLKPEQGALADEIDQFNSIESLASELNITEDKIRWLYNDNCEKILSIQVERSNYFNILQTLCETFQCWVRFSVEHEDSGAIRLDENHKPIKKIVFKEFIGKPNYAGFKYNINLNSIQRTINSSEFVTKLIVGSSASEYTESKNLSITEAPSNVSGESFIFNFNYYLKTGLIDRESFNAELNDLYEKLHKFNSEIVSLNETYSLGVLTLSKLRAQRDVFVTTVNEANAEVIKSIEEFEKITGIDYNSYTKQSVDSNEKANDENVREILYRIYTNAAVVNSYGGIIDNIKSEYNTLNLDCNGAETFSASVLTTNGTQETSSSTKLILSNYLEGFSCDFIKNDEVVESFNSDLTTKTFTSDVAYDFIRITKIPENYYLEYYNNGRSIICEDVASIMISIYDIDNQVGLTRRFKIKPTDAFLERNRGYKYEIQQLTEEKDKLLNDFQIKYSKFIQEGTWESTDYLDSDLYYLDAIEVSNTSAQPKVTYTINVAEISEQEGFENYTFNVGDKTYVEDTQFFGATSLIVGDRIIRTPIKEEVVVSAVEWHLDDPAENIITVQNYKTQFEDLFQRISATVQSVQYNSASYSRAASIFDENGNINADLLVSSLNNLSGSSFDLASGGAVRATREGLIVRDLTSSGNYIIIKSGGIERSTDGGYTWEKILSADGISINALRAGTIDTTQISIMDGDNPSFRWDKSGLSAFGYDENGGYDLNTFVRFDKYGLYGIKQGGDYVVSSLEDLQDKAHFGITWDGFFIKNNYTNGYVSISSDNDFQIMRKVTATDEQDYELTHDVEIDVNKQYYVLQQDIGYAMVDLAVVEDLVNYYEFDEVNQIYYLTTDTEIDSNKDYYIYYEAENYVPVEQPIVEGLSQYYENIKQYIDDYIEKIKIGAIEFDNDNTPVRYGITIRNDRNDVVFTTDDNGDLIMSGTIYASAGHIGGMKVNNSTLTMDTIVLEPDRGIYSTNTIYNGENYEPVFIISDVDGSAIFNDVTARGHIDATSGTLGNLDIINGITVNQNGYIQSNNWDTQNNTGWKITDTIATFNNIIARGHIEATSGTLGNLDVIDTITVGTQGAIESDNWSEQNQTGWHIDDIGATFNNANVRGTITALQGDFLGEVRVGPTNQGQDHIIIDGTRAAIKSSNYQDGAGYGWMINKDGDAVFNNITARGAIKTAVFEYAEIQAVGGIFIFRPSSTIKAARLVDNEQDLILKVEKPALFAKTQGQPFSWCKISNYTSDGSEPNVQDILRTNGLTHVYQIISVDLNEGEITLKNGVDFINAVIQEDQTIDDVLNALEGGALVDMGQQDYIRSEDTEVDSEKNYYAYNALARKYEKINNPSDNPYTNHYYEFNPNTSNYGIGVNSSDNTVNLPRRAISLFETIVDENADPKVSYKYRGILGTLPELPTTDVNYSIYNSNMVGTQGIYTNNMYIGDNKNFITYYYDKTAQEYRLIINADTIYEGYDEDDQPIPITPGQDGKDGKDGEDAIIVTIDSSAGTVFLNKQITTVLTCTVTKGNGTDITNQVTRFTWSKKNADGTPDTSWSRPLAGNTITLSEADVTSKAIFTCEVEF